MGVRKGESREEPGGAESVPKLESIALPGANAV
jgi:hypothetical protein